MWWLEAAEDRLGAAVRHSLHATWVAYNQDACVLSSSLSTAAISSATCRSHFLCFRDARLGMCAILSRYSFR